MLRGGAWNNNDNNARSSNRNNNQPDNRNNNVGFRCAQQSFYSMCAARGVAQVRMAGMSPAFARYSSGPAGYEGFVE